MFIVAVIVFVVLLLVLVLVHEWGHLIVAKKAGCRVEEFGFGFPPKLFAFKKGETEYSFNLLPIGGFVKIEGEDMQEKNPGPRSFGSKSAGWRTIILAAGVIMNVVLAWVLLSIQAGVGMPVLVTEENAAELTDHRTYILSVSDTSPAMQAGLNEFDRIAAIDSIENPTIEDIQHAARTSAGQQLMLEIERQGQHINIELTPRANPPEGEGAIGISLGSTGLQRVPWWQTPWEGLKRTGQLLVAITVQFTIILQRVFEEGTLGKALTGPIGIAMYTNEATRMGLPYLLEFAALISTNLALINILPFPALDGGRIVFIAIEKLIGRRLPGIVEHYANTAGFALLIALMLFITLKDVQRFF